ncbi:MULTISPECIES: hypothetical protein [unclassified Mesorhizobium]|uniref:hypothetical protein n=1 Tax=unclassified Mesorhizobium TaxID=325217 RepID=UPI000FCCBB00|nr:MULTISPECIES: hypothetical protein [unclassified Mesorhizobium]RUW01448.1 hypothetical protein EOA49_10930 [Mesorhizobium sp. M1A.F.Ca.IN.020.04.1.1]RUW07298.1 hypothetical protein EOA53_21430 [Mesorhizobium sp. M1A.F.Ca.IN.020.03.1.1]RWF70822.1 MAG: hypothetical protein EOQ34_17420 [Mesorhizobium sp.]RWG10530.1 MAG: hypothetical protein EOQ58_26705 [Mesorhizobium sp.]RWG25396.1 MAG: hypothetical protein EOQ61_29100 [Mesorhizobium sp.]
MDAVDRVVAQDPLLGTRFLVYPQVPHLSGYGTPETVWISTPPDLIRSGPEDHRIYVRDPLLDKEPYDYPYLPPFVGEIFPPAEAGFDGHFDQLSLTSRQFLSAHAFASVSRVLDIWESYLGKPIVWYFAETYERLEIIPFVDWENAQSGYGYLELGRERGIDGGKYPYALNFDVIAHEVGHAILFSLFGTPAGGLTQGDFGPFHEANSDLVSLLSFLNFDSGMDRLLRHCDGNLLVLNELSRIAELTGDRQIRLASNARRMSEVTAEIHDRSRPFTGAVFDTIVDVYHAALVHEGLADERLLGIDIKDVDQSDMQRISDFTSRAFRARPFMFKSMLIRARDEVALALAQAWPRLDADDLTFENAAATLVDVSDRVAPALAENFEENFRWREIL